MRKMIVASALILSIGQPSCGMNHSELPNDQQSIQTVETQQPHDVMNAVLEAIRMGEGRFLLRCFEWCYGLNMLFEAFPGIFPQNEHNTAKINKNNLKKWRDIKKIYAKINNQFLCFTKPIPENEFKKDQFKPYDALVNTILREYGYTDDEHRYLIGAAYLTSIEGLKGNSCYLKKIDALRDSFRKLTEDLCKFVRQREIFDVIFPKIETKESSGLIQLLQKRDCKVADIRTINLEGLAYKDRNQNIPEYITNFYQELGLPDFSRYLHPNINFEDGQNAYDPAKKVVYVDTKAKELKYYTGILYAGSPKDYLTKLYQCRVISGNIFMMGNHEMNHAINSPFLVLVDLENFFFKNNTLNASLEVLSKVVQITRRMGEANIISDFADMLQRTNAEKVRIGDKEYLVGSAQGILQKHFSFSSQNVVKHLYIDNAIFPIYEVFQVNAFIVWGDSLIYNPANDNLIQTKMGIPYRFGHSVELDIGDSVDKWSRTVPGLSFENQSTFEYFILGNAIERREGKLTEAQRKLENGEPLNMEEEQHRQEITEAARDVLTKSREQSDIFLKLLKLNPLVFIRHSDGDIILDPEFVRLLNGISEADWEAYLTLIRNEQHIKKFIDNTPYND